MPLVDYLLLTPLDEEWKTLRRVLCPDPQKITSKPIEAITYYLWEECVDQPHASGEYLVVAASMGRRTPGQAHAGVFASHCMRQWRPGRVVLLGIAGSLEPDRLQLGDVVVSQEIYGFEVGDAIGSKTKFRPTFNQAGALDLDRVRAFLDDPIEYPVWQQECLEASHAVGLQGVSRPPELHIEVTASGNEVVKSRTRGQQLKREINAKISAVEMEARGLHQALYMDESRRDALMIRGVSDYADKNKSALEKASKGNWRTFAVANAARLLQRIWRRGPTPPLSPPYKLDLTTGPHTRFRQGDVPNIEFKKIGAQDVAFPGLIVRHSLTPELILEVVAVADDDVPAKGYRGQCIVESPKRFAIAGVEQENGRMVFVLPASEWGMRVELLLSFPTSVAVIHLFLRDNFGRSTEESIRGKMKTSKGVS